MNNMDIEKLMRQTEISRPWEKDSLKHPLEYYRKVSKQLLDEFDETDDLRFLNTALKLNDMLRERAEKSMKELTRREADALRRLRRERGV